MAAHSWGENVFRNFLGWIERKDKGWTEKHIAAYVNIAGCVLGVPKVLLGSEKAGWACILHLLSRQGAAPNGGYAH